MITLGALVPHPPVMMEGIGKPNDLAQVEETRSALEKLDHMLAARPPETLVVFTPHGAVFRDAIVVYSEPVLTGSMRHFGLQRTWQWGNDQELVDQIIRLGARAQLPVYPMDQADLQRYQHHSEELLDHGVLAPLSFFNPEWSRGVKLVVIPLSYLPVEELYQFGALVGEAAHHLSRRVAVIASGDLSHALLPEAPAGYNPLGAEFDQKIIALISQSAVREFFELDPVMVEKAAECGFRSLIMLLGAFDGKAFQGVVHSYQGPFGVGYGVASFEPEPQEERESLIQELFAKRRRKIEKRRAEESPLVRYARGVIEAYVKEKELPATSGLDEFQVQRAGVFVSVKKHGDLRGCIGTTEPTQGNVIGEVRENAISAATRDPRFEPITEDELEDLVYSVDVLKPAEPIVSSSELDPLKYGVIVSKGYRRGLLLPNLEGVETIEQQISIAKQKAGIGSAESVDLERFEVVRYV
jgi:AmmeMemoRadiSam system protein A